MSPTDSFDEAVADMISDGVVDLRNGVIKVHFEKDEAKKVFDCAFPSISEKEVVTKKCIKLNFNFCLTIDKELSAFEKKRTKSIFNQVVVTLCYIRELKGHQIFGKLH